MRPVIGLYLATGIVLLLVGYYITGDCSLKNIDIASDAVFVAAWPGYLYTDVINGPMTIRDWLHLQACQGGVVAARVPFLR